jgi:hypothetical protein
MPPASRSLLLGLMLVAVLASIEPAWPRIAAEEVASMQATPTPSSPVQPQPGVPLESEPPPPPSGGWALLWWLLIPIGLVLMIAAWVTTIRVHHDPIGLWGPWWAVLWQRREERRRRDEDF